MADFKSKKEMILDNASSLHESKSNEDLIVKNDVDVDVESK